MEVTVILNVLILIVIVLYAVHFSRLNNQDRIKKNQIDKALYIEVRRASRLSLQCNMGLTEMSDRQESIVNDIEHVSSVLRRLGEMGDQDVALDRLDDVQDDGDALKLILIRQRQILKHLEKLEEQLDNKPTEDEESD